MKRAFLLIIIIFSMPGFCRAQSNLYSILSDTTLSGTQKLDRLQLALRNTANDTVRMNVNFDLALYFLETNRDSAVYYDNKSIALARRLGLKLNEAEALSDKGYALIALGKYPSSLESLSEAIKIAENPASEKYVLPFLRGQAAHKDRLYILGQIYLHLGQLYGATGNMNLEKLNYFKVLGYAQSIQDTFLLSLAYINLGKSYTHLNQLDSALYFEQKALELQPHLGFFQRTWEGTVLYLLGNIYLKKGKLTQARDAYLKSVESYKVYHNLHYLPDTYNALSKLYQRLNKPDSSLFYARKILVTALVLRQPQPLVTSYRALSNVYNNLNNRDSTLKYLQLYTVLNDSLNNAEKKNLLSYQNIGFDQQLRLKSLQEEKIETQNKIRTFGLISGIVFFMIIALLLYRNGRNRKKANQLLQKQNDIIHSENERRAAELEEARRLQLAMLPKDLPKFNRLELAVFMQTATEVGGDYYDFSRKEDGSVNIAIGDATGHGMKAGTLVTMMKSLFTVNSTKSSMEEFFNSSNTAIKNSNLKRMMVGFAMINITDHKAKLINAGMPPVYHYKKNESRVEELRQHSLPLGAMAMERYNSTEINLNSGDTLIMMSDGYPELHNQSDELFGYEKVLSTIGNNAEKEPEELIKLLKEEGTEWRGEKELLDDVTFVVVKVK